MLHTYVCNYTGIYYNVLCVCVCVCVSSDSIDVLPTSGAISTKSKLRI